MCRVPGRLAARAFGFTARFMVSLEEGGHVGLMAVDLPLSAPSWGEPLRGFALSVIFPLILVDLLLPVFPLWGYLGRQVWNWSCVAWGAIAVAAVGSIVLRFVLG